MTPSSHHLTLARQRRVAATVAAAALLAISAVAPTAAYAPPRPLILPVEHAPIVALARLPAADWKPGHRGIDIAARTGADVVATGPGTVIFAGWVVNRPVVTLDHGGGLVSSLEPVDATVALGTTVAQGDVIGTKADAHDHCSPGACVHWGLRLDGVYVDPLDYLAGYGPVVLLPAP